MTQEELYALVKQLSDRITILEQDTRIKGNPSDVPLKEYLKLEITAVKEYLRLEINAVKEQFKSDIVGIKETTTLALTTLDKRLDGMNEFRDTLRDQNATFSTREEMQLKFDALEKGRKDTSSMTLAIISIVVSIIGIIVIIVIR